MTPTSTANDLADVVAAAHAAALVADAERYLRAVVAFDAEGVSPFRAQRKRAAHARELPARA